MSTLKAMFHPENLLPTYNRMMSANPTPIYDRLFVNPMNTALDEVRLMRTPLNRTPAPLNNRNAPAKVLPLIGADDAKGAMFHAFDMITMPAPIFQSLYEPESNAVNEIASGEIARQMEAYAQRHAMQHEVAMSQFVTTGGVRTDAEGDFVTTGGTFFDFGIPDSHKTDLNGIIETDWDESDAKILTQFENIDIAAGEQGVPAPTLCIANSTVKPYLRENSETSDWIKASYNAADRSIRGQFIEGLLGRNWLFVDTVWTDKDGAVHKHIPDGVVVMLPDPATARGWLRCMNGLELVPTSRDLMPNVNAAKGKIMRQYGRFSYAAIEHNPLRLDVFMGDHFGWVVAEPNAIWIAQVVGS